MVTTWTKIVRKIKGLVLYAAKAIAVAVAAAVTPILTELFLDIGAQLTVGVTATTTSVVAYMVKNAPTSDLPRF